MFYIKFLKNIFNGHKIITSAFIVCTILTTLFLQQSKFIQRKVDKAFNSNKGIYFHALIKGDQNFNYLRTKLTSFPGVGRVELKGQEYLKNQVKNLLASLGEANTSGPSYTGLTVYMTKDVGARSMNLLKEYIGRIVGVTNLETSRIIKENKNIKETGFKGVLINKFALIGNILLFTVWSFLFILFTGNVKKYVVIYQNYQRRRNIVLPLMLMIFLIAGGIGTIASVGLFSLNLSLIVFSFIGFFLISLMSSKLMKWN
jgi:hypothetical protein